MGHNYSYQATLAIAERVGFQLDDVLPLDAAFDFSRPFLPDGLARSRELQALGSAERLVLNQVRGASYLSLFGLVEEFILPFVLDHARADLSHDAVRTRALLQFAGEEAKHIQLFRRFSACFERGFGSPCSVIGPASEIARVVLGHGPLGVALLILHIEWLTQRHYVEGVRDETTLEPLFSSLLRNHWLEEAQHAKLDTLMVEQLAAALSPREVQAGVEEYLSLVSKVQDLLDAQVDMDIDNVALALKRSFRDSEWCELQSAQRRATYWTFLGSGMSHPRFIATLDTISPASVARVRAAAERFC